MSGTKRPEQPATLARIGERVHVIAIVFEQYFALFGRSGINEHQGCFVTAAIAHTPHHFVVGSEERVAHRFAEIGGEHGTECFAFVVAVENLGVHAVDDGIDHTQTTVVVGGPSLIVAGVFGQERELARVEIETIGIEGFGVAAIHFNEDLPGNFGEVIDDVGAHSGKIGVGAFVAPVAANAEKVVVLVAPIVFGINQTVVVGPKVAAETAFGLAGESKWGAECAIGGDAAHKKVHAVAIGGKIGEMAPIGRKTEGGRSGVAEEIFEGNHVVGEDNKRDVLEMRKQIYSF